MSSIERGGFFWSRLAKVFRPEQIKDQDMVPSDAKERVQALHARLIEESKKRKDRPFNFPDQKDGAWEVKILKEAIETEYVSFVLRRSVSNTSGALIRRRASGTRVVESFFIGPWHVAHLDFSTTNFNPSPINSTGTLNAAEALIASIPPADAKPPEGVAQLSEMPK